MDKDLEDLNENDNKVNETLDKTNHNKEIFKKLEKHLSPDIPTIKFYDKIKYKGKRWFLNPIEVVQNTTIDFDLIGRQLK